MIAEDDLASPPKDSSMSSAERQHETKRSQSKELQGEGDVTPDSPRRTGMTASTEAPIPGTEGARSTSLRLQDMESILQTCTDRQVRLEQTASQIVMSLNTVLTKMDALQ